jgi:Skp family chaperone for outer membrane proteins
MMEENITEKVNVIELLMNIHSDVSSIKTNIENMEKTQQKDKEAIQKDIADVRADYQRDLTALESKLTSKIAVLQTTQNNFLAVQNNLVGDVDNLKTAEDKKLAKRYRTTIAFILTGVGGMALAKLPDFIAFCVKLSGGVK